MTCYSLGCSPQSAVRLGCLLLLYLFFVPGIVQGQKIYAEKIPQYNRRVLILNFVNQQKNANTAYLSVTIAEALIDPLKKTGKFEILLHSGTATFDETEAVAEGLEAKADVVVIGNFVTIQNSLQIQAKAIDVGEKRLVLSKSRTTPLNAMLFDNVNALAADMTREMAQKLPPLTERVVVHEAVGDFIARAPVFHLYGDAALVWGRESKYFSHRVGGGGDASFQFLHRYLQPYFAANTLFETGAERITKMNFFGADGGLSYTFSLATGLSPWLRGILLRPLIGGGFQTGTIEAAHNVQYLVPDIFAGVVGDFFISENLGVAMALKQYVLMESQTTLKILTLQIGVGVRL